MILCLIDTFVYASQPQPKPLNQVLSEQLSSFHCPIHQRFGKPYLFRQPCRHLRRYPNMSATQGTFSMPQFSQPPPADLGTYARLMHQHTKRQMEAISQYSQSPPRSNHHNESSPTGMPDGIQSRRRDSSQHSHQS
jgi:hypothetical protein